MSKLFRAGKTPPKGTQSACEVSFAFYPGDLCTNGQLRLEGWTKTNVENLLQTSGLSRRFSFSLSFCFHSVLCSTHSVSLQKETSRVRGNEAVLWEGGQPPTGWHFGWVCKWLSGATGGGMVTLALCAANTQVCHVFVQTYIMCGTPGEMQWQSRRVNIGDIQMHSVL